MPLVASERALAAVPFPDCAADVGGNPPSLLARARRPRPLGSRELARLEPANQGIQRQIENLGDVAGRDLVTEQVLGAAQLVVRGL